MKYWPKQLEEAYMHMRREKYIKYIAKEKKEKLPKMDYTTDIEEAIL